MLTNFSLLQGCSAEVFLCNLAAAKTDVAFSTIKSINNTPSMNQSPDNIVVKVCNISEEVKLEAARKEAKVLRQLNCDHINKFVDFYEDPIVNKAYLVLEYAGVMSIG